MIDVKIEIVEEKENPFFKRKELRVEVSHESAATPSKAELAKELATKYKVDEAQVAIDYMFTTKGVCKTTARVKVLKEKPKVKGSKEIGEPDEKRGEGSDET